MPKMSNELLKLEVDRLTSLWNSLKEQLDAAKAFQNRSGGQQTNGPLPRFFGIKPSALNELEWFCRAALNIKLENNNPMFEEIKKQKGIK
jgi:ABC-type phosphate transport system ATPase subunit